VLFFSFPFFFKFFVLWSVAVNKIAVSTQQQQTAKQQSETTTTTMHSQSNNNNNTRWVVGDGR